MKRAIQIGRIVHFVLPNGWHRPAWVLDVGSDPLPIDGKTNAEAIHLAMLSGQGQLLEVHAIPGEGTGFGQLVEGLAIFYVRSQEGHRARDWHFHEDCKGGRHIEEEPPMIPISLHMPPHLRWSEGAMAGGEERLELVHIPGECANCDALR